MLVENQKVKVKWHRSNKEHYTSLGYKFTKMKDEFYVDINHLTEGSKVKVKFVCDYCDGKNQIEEKDKWKIYQNLVKEVNKTGEICCGRCGYTKRVESNSKYAARKGNSLAERFPHLVEEWSDKNEKTPWDYGYGSKQKVWWIGKCGHEWKTMINNRSKGRGCPYCSGNMVCEDNCLATIYPDLAKQWHPTKNEDLTPYDVTIGSEKKVWWFGECGHEWEAIISNRTKNEAGCFECKKEVISIKKRLTINQVREYVENNSDSILVSKTYLQNDKPLEFMCKCGNIFITTLGNFQSGKKRCDKCSKVFSRGEYRIITFFTKNNIKYKYNKRFNECRNKYPLPFDFQVEDMVLIEYDGRQHFYFDENSGFGNYESFISGKRNDQIKNTYCINRNISLIRIPYWEFNNIEYILEHVLGYFNIIDEQEVDEQLVHKFLVNHADWSHDKYLEQAI